MVSLRKLFVTVSAMGLALQGCTTATSAAGEPAAVAPVASGTGPALWKAADADTTIYLFGTVHALPQNVEWFPGMIENALKGSGELVTEIPVSAMTDPATQQVIMQKAMLPAGQSLRDLLSDTQRTRYEAALASFSLPPAAFDQFEPWFAAITLSVLPLIKNGWTAESGVEHVINTKAGPAMPRSALETVEQQMAIFDTLSQDAQVAYLDNVVENIDQVQPTMDRMLAEWVEGDADDLADIMNESMSDPALAKALLYDRNANWAQWIDDRMDRPGTVFVAVGAGHLAGDQSVQDYLEQRGLKVTRVK